MILNEVEIESIEEIEYDEDIYLMEVENNHNYFIDGVLSKNCQNLSRDELRTVLSRMGDNTKVVCAGDVRQIDNHQLNQDNNGLNWMVRLLKGADNYGHIVLSGNRSRGPIADLVRERGL